MNTTITQEMSLTENDVENRIDEFRSGEALCGEYSAPCWCGPVESTDGVLDDEGRALGAHPNIATGEVDIESLPGSDEAINQAVARFQVGLSEWTYRGVELGDVIGNVRAWTRELWDRFIPDEWAGRPVKRPPILFRFESESPRILGHYQPGRNDIGCRWEISLNPRHLPSRSEIELAETVLHELLHCFEDLAGTAPRSHNNYHSAWFRKTADALGIPCSRYGATLGIREPSPFMDWAHKRGLSGCPAVCVSLPDLPPARAPKRFAWACDCPPDVAVTVQVARGSELDARCQRCGALFRKR